MDRHKLIINCTDTMDAIRRLMFSKHLVHHEHKDLPTKAQMAVLYAVSLHHDASVKDLAQKFSMSSSAVTQLIDGLVKDGLLERKEHSDDRRKLKISITHKGEEQLSRARALHIASLTKILEPLTDEELKALCTIQEKIRTNLE